MSSCLHANNKSKDILILDKGRIQRLDNTSLAAEAEYFISFSRLERKFCLRLHYNGSNSFSFINATKIHQFKAKDCEIKSISCVWEIFQKTFL